MEQTAIIPEELRDANKNFRQQLDAISGDVAEVETRRESIETAGAELIDEFSVDPEFFNDKTHALMFAAIAERYADLESNKDTKDHGQYGSDKEFIFNATTLLTLGSSGLYTELRPYIEGEETVGDDDPKKEKVYNSFTNREVTQDLENAISGGLLDEVKKKLGINPDNEDKYVVRVLNIGDEHTAAGMQPTTSKDMGEKPYNGPEWQEFLQAQESFNCYLDGLEQRKELLSRDLGWPNTPPAWVTPINGVPNLCLPLPIAEKILYKDQPRANFYDVFYEELEFAFLAHEYTHTQGGLNLSGDLFFGIGVEEVRAEHFAGNKMGYRDAKGFYADITRVTGFSAVDFMDEHEKGGNMYDFYKNLTNRASLQSVLEIAIMPPSVYIDDNRVIQRQIAEHLGGFDAITKRVYEQVVREGRSSEIDSEIEDSVDRLIAGGHDLESYFYQRKKVYGLNFITDKMRAVYEGKKPKSESQQVT